MTTQKAIETEQRDSRHLTTAPPRALASYTDTAVALPPAEDLGDSYSATAMRDVLDHSTRAMLARMTGGLSPAALGAMWADWVVHLASSPGKQGQLWEKALRKSMRFRQYALHCALSGGTGPCCIEPLAQDRRFRHEAWQKPPFNLLHQAFLLNQQWWHNATTGVRGLCPCLSRGRRRSCRNLSQ